jgi:hypothetical protein
LGLDHSTRVHAPKRSLQRKKKTIPHGRAPLQSAINPGMCGEDRHWHACAPNSHKTWQGPLQNFRPYQSAALLWCQVSCWTGPFHVPTAACTTENTSIIVRPKHTGSGNSPLLHATDTPVMRTCSCVVETTAALMQAQEIKPRPHAIVASCFRRQMCCKSVQSLTGFIDAALEAYIQKKFPTQDYLQAACAQTIPLQIRPELQRSASHARLAHESG